MGTCPGIWMQLSWVKLTQVPVTEPYGKHLLPMGTQLQSVSSLLSAVLANSQPPNLNQMQSMKVSLEIDVKAHFENLSQLRLLWVHLWEIIREEDWQRGSSQIDNNKLDITSVSKNRVITWWSMYLRHNYTAPFKECFAEYLVLQSSVIHGPLEVLSFIGDGFYNFIFEN